MNHDEPTTYDAPRYKPAHVYTDAILARVTQLVDPITTRERHETEEGMRTHVTKHPSLLEQLAAAVTGTTGPAISGGPGFESKPAARIDALDALERIASEARHWVYALEGTPRPTPAGNLRALAGLTTRMGIRPLADLDHDTRSWTAAAATVSGFDTPPWRPHVQCPLCNTMDSLRVRTDPTMASCTACGEGWDTATIGILGEHIRLATETPTALVQLVDHGHDHHSGRGYHETNPAPNPLAGITTDDHHRRITA